MIRANPSSATDGNYRQQLLEHALAYANNGWPVFPLRPGTKRPATPNHAAHNCTGTDPRCAWNGHTGWEQRATTDPGRIQRAWDQHPYGIGIACGPAGLIVIDLDIPATGGTTGAEALRHLEHEHAKHLPATFTVATPSGGRHLYYTAPKGQTLANTASRIGPHIDTRAVGGYVVAPPTRTAAGTYHIIDDHPPAPLPQWFSLLLQPPARAQPKQHQPVNPSPPVGGRVERYIATAINGEVQRVRGAGEGHRNQTLFTASVAIGQLVGAGLITASEGESALHDAAAGHVAASAYSRTQAQQTIASGLNRGQQEPRQLPTNLTRQDAA